VITAALGPLATPVSQLHTMPGNPRLGDVGAIARSLSAFGQRKPVVARRDGTVIAGNHTLQAAIELGWDELAVVFVDDDDATAHAFALADNRTGDLGSYDERALADLILEVQAADSELFGAVGYSIHDLDELLAKLAKANVESPLAFDEIDESSIETEHQCPKCGYQWSGNGG
jgi:ParB-like chromosome segregation protein Spo0J